MSRARAGRTVIRWTWLGLLAVAVAGCGVYTANSGRVSEDRKRVFVGYLENETAESNLGVEFTDAIIEALQADNTLKVVGEPEADAVVSGRVSRYTLREMATRPDLTVDEYQVQIAVQLTFTLKRTGETIFDKRVFTGAGNYVLNDPQGTTEQTARREAAGLIVRDILAQVVEDW